MHLLGIVAIICALIEIIKQATEKPPKERVYFDEDAYHRDLENGMDIMDAIKKQGRGGYNTTNPKYAPDALNDVERYERDKEQFGEEFAERNRKNGMYRFIVK